MAKYNITFSCGHEDRIDIFGRVKDRESKVEWFENHGLCSECYEAEKQRQFDDANQKAMVEAEEYGLPDLTGTEKQVAWANTLRQNWIKAIEDELEREGKVLENLRGFNPESDTRAEERIELYGEAIQRILKEETAARFWIDQRDSNPLTYLKKVADKVKVEINQPVVPEEVKEEVLEEMTLRPSEPVTDLVTEIRLQVDSITAKLPEKNEEFRLLLRGLRFEWVSGRWTRKIVETKGSMHDRAAELGIKLLAAGFPIRVYDEQLQQQIQAGTYEPECRRWVLIYEKGFRVWWDRDEGDFYQAAKRLPGSVWVREKQSMYIPSEAFRDLQGFADRYSFQFTQAAQARLQEAAEAFEAAMILDVVVPERERLPEPGAVPTKLAVEDFSVDESLKEE